MYIKNKKYEWNRGLKMNARRTCLFLWQFNKKSYLGPTEIWTRIAGFRVQSANHYTMGPYDSTLLFNSISFYFCSFFKYFKLYIRSGFSFNTLHEIRNKTKGNSISYQLFTQFFYFYLSFDITVTNHENVNILHSQYCLYQRV